tara:strand:- start:94666 stop:94923 length:258 start_codon:yes stop_codon:yes gene_type:complete
MNSIRNKKNKLNFNRVSLIIRDNLKNIKASVIYERQDGSKQIRIVKKESLMNEKNIKISASQYINNLNGVKHDLNAVEYTVNIIK